MLLLRVLRVLLLLRIPSTANLLLLLLHHHRPLSLHLPLYQSRRLATLPIRSLLHRLAVRVRLLRLSLLLLGLVLLVTGERE